MVNPDHADLERFRQRHARLVHAARRHDSDARNAHQRNLRRDRRGAYQLLRVFNHHRVYCGTHGWQDTGTLWRKLEAKEIKVAAIALLLQPFLVLVPSAVTVATASLTGNSNPGFHGLSQVFYEYTSAFANNGSGFEGLGDNTVWWNSTTAVVLILARFIPIIAPLAIASSLARKRVAPETAGTLRVSTPIFAVTLLSTIVLLTLLNFLPVLVLGPIAEQLTTVSSVTP